MNRSTCCLRALIAFAVVIGAPTPTTAATVPLRRTAAIRLPLFLGLYDDKGLYYISRDSVDLAFAQSNHIPYAPRLAQAAPDGVDEFYVVTNGVKNQVPVLGSIPGEPDYSPIWRLVRLTWKSGATRKLLGSDDEINAEIEAGRLTEQETDTIFDCPVILLSDRADGRSSHLAPTLSLGPQVVSWDLKPGAPSGSVLLRVEPGWYDDRLFGFLDLEGAPAGMKPNAPPVSPVPKLGVASIGTGGKDPFAHFYVVQDQNEPVLAAVPDDEDVQANYSPLWHVHLVTFNDGVRPRELHAESEIQSAVSKGDVKLQDAGPDAVFNCPVVNGAQVRLLPLASDEVAFLVTAGLITMPQGTQLLTDLRRRDDDAYRRDVNALVAAGSIKLETALLLFELAG